MKGRKEGKVERGRIISPAHMNMDDEEPGEGKEKMGGMEEEEE
jgi:hypothetical protein